MPRGRTKDRLTVALDPVVARSLRVEAAARKATVSGVAEEALRVFLRDAHREASERLAGPDGRDGDEESAIVAGMVLELLRYQLPSAGDISDEELRRRAVAVRGGRARGA